MKENFREDYIPIGKIIKPHGFRGELKLKPLTNMDEIFENLNNVYIYNEDDEKSFKSSVIDIRKTGKGYVFSLNGINDQTLANRLRNHYVYIKKDFLPELKDGEYFFFQVLDCEVYNENDVFLGVVTDIIETGAKNVLVVQKEENRNIVENLIPIVDDFILNMDLENKKIIVRILEYENGDI